MNVFRILIPCALQRGERSDVDRGGCWSIRKGRNDDTHMTHRMGTSASSNLAAIGGDPIQAARLSSSGNVDQCSIGIRYVFFCSFLKKNKIFHTFYKTH